MRKIRNGSGKALAALLGTATLNLFAQSPPGAISLGPLSAYPEIEVGIKHDDNIALQPLALKRADVITMIRPSVRVEGRKGENAVDVTYRGEYLSYAQQTTDNVQNHEIAANGNMTFDVRNNLKLKLQYLDRFDQRGTLNLGATPTPNQSHQSTFSGLYTYGADGARGRLEFLGGYSTRRYINNRAQTAALDQERSEFGGTFLLRVQPKTYATFTLRQANFHYPTPGTTLDSKDNFYLVGVRWDVTAATTGRFSIGKQTKKFESAGTGAGRAGFNGLSWEGGVTWKPLSYSSVDFNTRRATSESTGLGDFNITQSNQAVWTHAWTSNLSSNLSAGYGTDRFSAAPIAGAGGNERSDKTITLGLRVNYAVRRWLKVGADFTHTERDSIDNTANYKRNQLMFFLAATI